MGQYLAVRNKGGILTSSSFCAPCHVSGLSLWPQKVANQEAVDSTALPVCTVAPFLEQKAWGSYCFGGKNSAGHIEATKHTSAVLTELNWIRWCCQEEIAFNISVNDSEPLFSHSCYKYELNHGVIWHFQWDFFWTRDSMGNYFSVERKHCSQAWGQLP